MNKFKEFIKKNKALAIIGAVAIVIAVGVGAVTVTGPENIIMSGVSSVAKQIIKKDMEEYIVSGDFAKALEDNPEAAQIINQTIQTQMTDEQVTQLADKVASQVVNNNTEFSEITRENIESLCEQIVNEKTIEILTSNEEVINNIVNNDQLRESLLKEIVNNNTMKSELIATLRSELSDSDRESISDEINQKVNKAMDEALKSALVNASTVSKESMETLVKEMVIQATKGLKGEDADNDVIAETLEDSDGFSQKVADKVSSTVSEMIDNGDINITVSGGANSLYTMFKAAMGFSETQLSQEEFYDGMAKLLDTDGSELPSGMTLESFYKIMIEQTVNKYDSNGNEYTTMKASYDPATNTLTFMDYKDLRK